MACFNGSHLTALISSIGSRMGPPTTHMPELYDFDPAIYRVQHRPEKTVDGNLVSGFFQHLSSGGSERMLTWIELALWQDPGLVPSQSHDCDARSAAFL